MKVLNPDITAQTIEIVPRRALADNPVFTLENELTKYLHTLTFTHDYTDGILTLSFDFKPNQGERFKVTLADDSGIAYRGLTIATTYDTMTPTPLYYE